MAESTNIERLLDEVALLLRGARSLLFITGAGISADSGLPTYRGVGGLYDVDDTEEGLPIETLLSGAMMRSRPELTWKYLAQIGEACRGATFNRGHEVIAEMERQFERVWTLTQNVDGFHRQAGSNNVIEIHGDLHQLVCRFCAARRIVAGDERISAPPRCPDCSAIMRPDVVLFGELLPVEKVALLHEQQQAGFDVVFSVGTSSAFPYIVEPVVAAARRGTPTVEINPGETEITSIVDVRLPMRAAEALESIWQRCRATGA